MEHNNELAARGKRVASTKESGVVNPQSNLNDSTSAAWCLSGFTQVPNLLIRDPSITAAEKIILITLLSYAWGSGTCYPAQKTLAKDNCVDPRTIRRILHRLENKGYISVEKRPGKVNHYHIKLSEDGSGNGVEKGMSRVGRIKLSRSQDSDAHEEYPTKMSARRITKIEEDDGINSEVHQFLVQHGVYRGTALKIASMQHADLDYVTRHIRYAEKEGTGVRLAVVRIKSGDNAPLICLECEGLNGSHALDCEIDRRRYVEGKYADFWAD